MIRCGCCPAMAIPSRLSVCAITSLNEPLLWARICLYSCQERNGSMGPLLSDTASSVTCCGFSTGSGLSSSEFTRLKMAVLAPMPSASVSTAVMAKLGARPS